MSPGTCKGGEAAGGAEKGKGKGQNEARDPQEHQERQVCVSGGALRQIIALFYKGDLEMKRSLMGRENNPVISFVLRQTREPDSH